MLARTWRKGNPSVLLLGMQTGAATVEKSTELPQNLQLELPYDPIIPLLRIYLKKTKKLIQKNIGIPMFTAALLTITKI